MPYVFKFPPSVMLKGKIRLHDTTKYNDNSEVFTLRDKVSFASCPVSLYALLHNSMGLRW